MNKMRSEDISRRVGKETQYNILDLEARGSNPNLFLEGMTHECSRGRPINLCGP